MTDETNLLVYYNVLNKALNPRKFYESIITIDPSNITPNKVLPTKIFDYNSIINQTPAESYMYITLFDENRKKQNQSPENPTENIPQL